MKICMHLPILLSLVLGFVDFGSCLFEDQVGKFDWRQHYIGKLKFGFFDASSLERVIVATDQNVVAALSVKDGQILWRQILEINPRGDIKLLHVNTDPKTAMSLAQKQLGVMTVSGFNPALIRGWNAETGLLEWEWSLIPNAPDRAEESFWFYHNQNLIHIIPYWESHLEVSEYNANTGTPARSTSSKITAPWIGQKHCVLAAPYFACVVKNQLLAINLVSKDSQIVTKVFDEDISGFELEAVLGEQGVVKINNQLINLNDKDNNIVLKPTSTVYIDAHTLGKGVVLQATYGEQQKITISAVALKTGQIVDDINLVAHYPESLGEPQIVGTQCKSRNDVQGQACRILMATDDGAIVLLQQSKIKWIREESLTNIVAVDFLDLTLSDAEGRIEEELNNKDEETDINWDIYGAFIRRFHSQLMQLKNLVLQVLGLGRLGISDTQKAGLVRDDFGLHKMIVAVTDTGKVFGIDNISGKYHWILHLSRFGQFNQVEGLKLLVQRTSKFYPLAAQCVIVGRNKANGNGILYQFDPINGHPTKGDGIIELDYQIKQMTLLHETGGDYLKGLLILDQHDVAHTLSNNYAKLANGMYLYTADKDSGVLTGYVIENSGDKLQTTKTWQLNLGGGLSNSQKIINIAARNPVEHVHSQGRVLPDRSVLYKYLNPNLVAVTTHGPDAIHKYILNVHLIDVVSGSIVFSMTHRRVRGPFSIVHSENWLVYAYFNDKVRRTEITTVELYEGKTQANSTLWSSLNSPPLPICERQSYIIPTHVSALRETITEKGITSKHVLIALASGSVVEMSWALLDPRRPVTGTEKAREEGIIPYIPEIPLPHESTINYNQSVARIKGIHTAPSGLESTSLVIVYGLDIFVSRISPSKTFDLLKEDFDYFLITVVLIALTIASYVVRHLSSRKALKQAWK